MRRTVSVLAVLALLAVPLGLARPAAVAAAGTITVETKERGSEGPALHACYSVADLTESGGFNGGVGGACDGDDGAADGRTVVNLKLPCSPCRVSQGLPDKPDGRPTDYLPEPPQTGAEGQTFTFRNFLKPYLVVTTLDARTGQRVEGACIAVVDVDRGGGAFAGCDGTLVNGSGDQDGQRNGKIQTTRLHNTGNYRVDQKSPPPPGYVLGASVDAAADPAQTGEFEAVTVTVPPAPRIVIKTVDVKTGKRLPGACYAIVDKSHGGGLGTHCDGQLSGTGFGDQDGVKNGVVVTKPLPVGHTYLIDQTTAPRGYRLQAADREVTTVAGKNAPATFKNRPKG